MNKTERRTVAKNATSYLKNELPDGADSHQDDIDNVEIDFMETFPEVITEPNDLVSKFWDERLGWIVTLNDIN